MRFALACATALLSLALAAPASPGAEPEPATAAAKKKAGKSKKCKAGKVAVTLNGRRRCRSLSAALPRPKAADPRLLAAKAALGVDLGNLHDRRGRPAVSVADLLGPNKLRTAQKAIGKSLATVDRLSLRRTLASASASTAAGGPLAAASSAGACSGSPGGIERKAAIKGEGYDAK